MPRPHDCNHEDWPCCGCGDELSQEEQHEQFLADHEDDDPDEEKNQSDKSYFEPDDEGRFESDDHDTPLGEQYGGE